MKIPVKDTILVSIQFSLFVIYLFRIPGLDFQYPEWIKWIGLFLSVSGIGISVTAVITLNKNLSAYPTPKSGAELIQSGIYKFVRHPIYSGILFFTLGYSLFSESVLRLFVFISLLVLFRFKAAYEEKLLQHKYSGYTDYKKFTGMFLPKWK